MASDADCKNLRAFLLTIRRCEDTAYDEGYRALFGSKKEHLRLFDSYATHPRIRTSFRQKDGTINWTTAAGAFQVLAGTYDDIIARHRAEWERIATESGGGFSPEVQDWMATVKIRERHAYDDVCAGRWQSAVAKCAAEWASLPGGHYPQHARSWDFVQTAYVDAGGSFEAVA